MYSVSNQKWTVSTIMVIIVLLVFNPATYWVTNRMFGSLGVRTVQTDGGPFKFSTPTPFGFFLHVVVSLLLFRLSLTLVKQPDEKDYDDNDDKE
jgi:hypothetical protein